MKIPNQGQAFLKNRGARRESWRRPPPQRGSVRQLLAPGFFFIFPEEPEPPPSFTSFGSGLPAGAGWTGGAGATLTSEPPQPMDNVVANPRRVAQAITCLALISASPCIKELDINPDLAPLRAADPLGRSDGGAIL